jgi:hypothetical protein
VSGPAATLRDWATGRWWWWRLPLLVWLIRSAAAPLTDVDRGGVFGGIVFGAHEFGHLLWAPFGEWMGIAGGSLTQLLIPIGAGALMVRSRDWFGLAVAGLFLASSLGNLAWYVADARALELPLVSMSPDGAIHDWEYLLGSLGWLPLDGAIAASLRRAGWALVAASSLLGALLLWWMATARRAAD